MTQANMTAKERNEHMEREVAARREIMQREADLAAERKREEYAAEVRFVAHRIMTKLTAIGAMETKALYAHAASWQEELPTPDCNTAPTRQFRTVFARTGLVHTVMELLARSGRILAKRTKFPTTDYGSLAHVVTGAQAMPYRKHLRTWRIVRLNIERTRDLIAAEERQRRHSQVEVIHHPEATPAQIVQAARVAKAARNGNVTYAVSRRSGRPFTRIPKDTYYDSMRDHTPGAHADQPDAWLAEERQTSPVEAEELPWINNQDYELYKTTPLSPEVKATIRYQDKIGQGRRNARRVANRNKEIWLETNDGQAWLEAKAMELGKTYTEEAVASYTTLIDHPLPEDDDDVFSVAFD